MARDAVAKQESVDRIHQHVLLSVCGVHVYYFVVSLILILESRPMIYRAHHFKSCRYICIEPDNDSDALKKRWRFLKLNTEPILEIVCRLPRIIQT